MWWRCERCTGMWYGARDGKTGTVGFYFVWLMQAPSNVYEQQIYGLPPLKSHRLIFSTEQEIDLLYLLSRYDSSCNIMQKWCGVVLACSLCDWCLYPSPICRSLFYNININIFYWSCGLTSNYQLPFNSKHSWYQNIIFNYEWKLLFLLIFLLDLLTTITVLLWIDIKILQRLSTSASTVKLDFLILKSSWFTIESCVFSQLFHALINRFGIKTIIILFPLEVRKLSNITKYINIF